MLKLERSQERLKAPVPRLGNIRVKRKLDVDRAVHVSANRYAAKLYAVSYTLRRNRTKNP